MKAKVLIVDDEEFSLELLQELLGEQFTFNYARNGRAALLAVAADHPAIILMDVEMPGGMNGYEVCRALKDSNATQHIPVIFISAHTEPKNRLMAYESGGDDYVSKPFTAKELKHKFELALANQEKRNELAEKARQAATVAMISMRYSADSGVAFAFLSDIIRHTDLEDIAATTLNTLLKFRIAGAVQLRYGQVRVSRNSSGACTPVEDAVLTEMAANARIVDIGKRSAFNYARATIIVYDMPLQDPELYGRLKDTVLKMTEALDVRLNSLQAVTSAVEHSDALLELFKRNAALSRDIQMRLVVQRDENHRFMTRLAESLDHATASLAQPSPQKLLLERLALDARAQCQTHLNNGIEFEKLLTAFNTALPESPPKEALTAAKISGAPSNDVELF